MSNTQHRCRLHLLDFDRTNRRDSWCQEFRRNPQVPGAGSLSSTKIRPRYPVAVRALQPSQDLSSRGAIRADTFRPREGAALKGRGPFSLCL